MYYPDAFLFDEVNCQALSCLPLQDIQVSFDAFPLELSIPDFMGATNSVLQIQNAEYHFDKGYSPTLTVTIFGEKTYEGNGYGSDTIDYKLYDSAGYMVDTGSIFLFSLSEGDKFIEEAVIYDVTPGESYTFSLSADN